MKELARITESFTESVIREMTRVCDAMGGDNLSQGFPDFDAPQAVKEAAIRAVRDGHNQYPVTFGEPELRDAIAAKVMRYNGITCDPATEITVTCGATEAMIATLKAIINPGDEVIVFEPFYENYGPDAILSGATPRFVSLRLPDWSFDPDELAAAFNERTKAIIINTPNNPTGKVFSREELEKVAELCLQWDTYAITDEIYEHIIYDGAQHVSLATLPDMADRTVTINGLTKTYSVTGWRVGWAIASAVITQRIRKVHDFLTVGAPTPLQIAGVTALGLPDSYYSQLAEGYRWSRDYLFEGLTAAGFHPTLPQGSYYILARCGDLMERLGASDDTSFSRRLIEEIGVATVPGSSFFNDPVQGSGIVRFAYCKQRETLERVRGRLAELADGMRSHG